MKMNFKATGAILALVLAAGQPVLAQDVGGRGGVDRDEYSTCFARLQARETVPAELVRLSQQSPETTTGPITHDELDLICGGMEWLETWLEDANGNPIDGTYEYYCVE